MKNTKNTIARSYGFTVTGLAIITTVVAILTIVLVSKTSFACANDICPSYQMEAKSPVMVGELYAVDRHTGFSGAVEGLTVGNMSGHMKQAASEIDLDTDVLTEDFV